ncbi:roadblock/LC7 domain-containing protein [Streptomyces smyrnaeus]|uniref:Roadblock/LC7 domain-containing protein n=1 Tax=Streptomyces smyrnaeus TaxID=1387713 RepID=A0ABS3XWR3_9ACTN|nr:MULTISPECIES: roadblock/LC7 domain-containing protein [Streptomyces]MBO8199748.1 roadblock/LC7 domain-containing protein [Streptomyces smyrnaeus]MBQ0867708.1 roadblock/LC7 domain-containing protein [Streptomyces sp. RK75]MBQ1120456.1 roadblock/LC7 domain-containing protein [Streptomyces sp. B15]MBQ1159077.1 roadblock/LC7 domain-containing protein [Streptomyces sp. A73]
MTIPARRSLRDDTSWVLGPLLELPHVIHAAVISGDGLIEGRSPNLERDAAEGVAAMLSALQGAARTTTAAFAGSFEARLRQTVVESDHGWVFAIPAGENTTLAVFAGPEVNMGVVTHQMQVQVASLGAKTMSTPARNDTTT